MRHLDAYEEGRPQGRLNFEFVLEARERGEDVTDLVLLKLLPHTDTKGNRERGAWVHIAPAIIGDLKGWFQNKAWTKPEDWPAISEAILRFVQRGNDGPEQLSEACAEFARLPYEAVDGNLTTTRPDDNERSCTTVPYIRMPITVSVPKSAASLTVTVTATGP